MRVSYRGRSKRSSSYTGGSKSTTTTGTGSARVSTSTTTPSVASSNMNTPSQITLSNSGGSNGSGVFVTLLILDILILWPDYFGPVLDTAWNGKDFNPRVSGWMVIGSLVFIEMISIISSSSSAGSELAWTLTAGLWIIYIMFNGKNSFSSILKTLSNSSVGSASGNFSSTTNSNSNTIVAPPISNYKVPVMGTQNF